MSIIQDRFPKVLGQDKRLPSNRAQGSGDQKQRGAKHLCAGSRAGRDYFLYQKIASATSATVMIQRTMSLLRLFSFSSAIRGIQHTRNRGSSVVLIF